MLEMESARVEGETNAGVAGEEGSGEGVADAARGTLSSVDEPRDEALLVSVVPSRPAVELALVLRAVPALTTPSGTAARPPPKLATRPFSPATPELGSLLIPPRPNDPVGIRGASPSAPSWKRLILSEILPLAPVMREAAGVEEGVAAVAEGRFRRAIRSCKVVGLDL